MQIARVELEGAGAGGARARRPDRAPESPPIPVERGAPQSLTADDAADYLDLGPIVWKHVLRTFE